MLFEDPGEEVGHDEIADVVISFAVGKDSFQASRI